MSVEDNLQVVDDFEEAFNARDWNNLLGALAESVILYDPAVPEPFEGRAAVGELFQENVNVFPDARIEKERSFGQGDWVCVEHIETGTQEEPLTGLGGEISSTKKSYRIRTCYVFKVEHGMITEIRLYYDGLGMTTQLGIVP